ncbi:P-loop NTPase family protein [Adhaeretor mobilis]|uniref:Tyrosine-protein kinase YwqD n=1 Tax=Adhaeretor mobilis TaxID=1930276 RepID=A0A517MVU1_9BACT|nr:CpsD/CapB family tyrosine-protein kinase [Adhaeretor mobilis]QDS98995.1 Tyrosine-protein kinase YwqD [Adhaeretor mobilis]
MAEQVYGTQQALENANPFMANGDSALRSQLSADVPHRRGSEVYDAALMRLRVRMDSTHGMGYTVGITSCERGSGVSTLAANMAIRAADLQFGPVLLVDAHPGKSSVATAFGVEAGPGLGEVLSGRVPLEDGIQQAAVNGLDLMTLGGNGLLERASVETERIENLLKQLRAEYPIVFFDFPDAEHMMHTLALGQLMDGVLLVVRSERVRSRRAAESLRQLRSDGMNVVGSVMTRRRNYLPAWVDRKL